MKKFLSILVALVIVVGIGAAAMPVSAHGGYGRGHHGRGANATTSTRNYRYYTDEERTARREEHREAFEAYVDELVKNGDLTKAEGEEYKKDSDRLRAYCWDNGLADFSYEEHRTGRGLHCRW